ncbi:uncharacterized protein LOC142606034 [Castanea sativa]|uniref:uncharacterized protein LOC142606034 n=1 Tax=Castanea sativa TaxID=21020 RepID=UPI003F651C99
MAHGVVLVTSMPFYKLRKSRASSHLQFHMVLDSYNLADLGFIGYKYTWNNKMPGAVNIRERLDRVVANEEWQDNFRPSTVTHLFSHASDHRPLVLQMKENWRNRRRLSRGFKFEEVWLLWEDCEKTVLEALQNVGGTHTGLSRAKDKIDKCGEELVAGRYIGPMTIFFSESIIS